MGHRRLAEVYQLTNLPSGTASYNIAMNPAFHTPAAKRLIIVGGGAGGLELAARLGRRFGPAAVILVDSRPFHIWKPSLHEAAAGTLDIHQEGLSYEMLAHDNRFTFCLGSMTALDLAGQQLQVSSVEDEQADVTPTGAGNRECCGDRPRAGGRG